MNHLYDEGKFLRISDQPARMGICTGNQVHHAHKMAWTPALEELAHWMRLNGATWPAISEELEDRTGIRISDNACSDYIYRKYGEK